MNNYESTIAGGNQNVIDSKGFRSAIGGGFLNAITGSTATIGGGEQNIAGNDHATIGGGFLNVANGSRATIAGGTKNNAANLGSTVGGGDSNQALNNSATVGGGALNTADGVASTVAAGYDNHSIGDYSSVSGGRANIASRLYSAVGGGRGNTVRYGTGATIAGGAQNRAGLAPSPGPFPILGTGDFASVGGGYQNNAEGFYATVSGGSLNYAAGIYSTVAGGSGNSADGSGSFAAGRNARAKHDGSFVWGDGTANAHSAGPNRFDVLATGGFGFYAAGGVVSIGADGAESFGKNIRQMLNLYDTTYGIGVQNFAEYFRTDGEFLWYKGGTHSPNIGDTANGTQLMRLGSSGTLIVSGRVQTPVLEITGGADVAEPFQMTGDQIEKGAVVIIDAAHPGKLKLSERAYDTCVAGIVSGANGVTPGISLSQQGRMDGGKNVALSGRVYVLADASGGAIKPGDLLTTSGTPGHSMKVADHARAQGAVIGKAMSSLKEGKGMVLVLVSLQ